MFQKKKISIPLTVTNVRIIYAERSQDASQHYLTFSAFSGKYIDSRESPPEILPDQMLVGRSLALKFIVKGFEICIPGSRHGNPYYSSEGRRHPTPDFLAQKEWQFGRSARVVV